MSHYPSFTRIQRSWPLWAAVAAGALLLMLPAFYNGYPLLNPDDGTYISSGFLPETPNDRPIIYGLLLRVFSFNGVSLWLALCFQAYIVSWLVFRIAQHITGKKLWIPLLVTCLPAVISTLSWKVSELIPDVFTAIALMCIMLIVAGLESKPVTVCLYVLYFIAVATHMSHVMIFAILLVALLFFYRRIPAPAGVRPCRRILLLLFLTLATIAVMGSALSKSRHVFTIGALQTRGVLKPILDDKCQTEHFKLCAYKDALPADANEFIWNNNSPLYKEGGWEAVKDEYNRIIHISYTEPKYIKLQVRSSVRYTLKQLCDFRIGDGNWASPPGDYLYETIHTYLPHELRAFEKARQNTGRLQVSLSAPMHMLTIVLLASLAVLAVVVIIWKRKTGRLFIFWLLLSSLCLLLNAWSCGTFSQVNGRYGGKMIWLPVLNALLALVLVARPPKVRH